MRTIQQAMLEEVYLQADELSKKAKQTFFGGSDAYDVPNRGAYYITLEQLESIIKGFED